MIKRCDWCGDDPLYVAYHDHEWGVPVYDDQRLFEFLCLEGAQAGLSWITILRKRERYRQVFDQFDIRKVAAYDDAKVAELLLDAGIVRNRLKVNSVVKNAKAVLQYFPESGMFSEFLWSFVDGKPLVNHWDSLAAVPVSTLQSDNMAKALKKKGFSFVGTTICYAFMQAVGMVNDHLTDCFVTVDNSTMSREFF